jgi:hypothetical protein
MNDTNGNLIILSRAELLAALNHYGTRDIIGSKFSETDLDENKIQAVLEEGNNKLVDRNLGEYSPDKNKIKLNSKFESFIKPLVYRDLALILIVGVKGKGQFPLVYFKFEGGIVEHIVNEDRTHTLTIFTEIADLLQRFIELVPLQSVIRKGRQKFEIEHSFFENIVKLSKDEKRGTQKVSKELERLNIDNIVASKVASALTKPDVTISLALVLCEGDKVSEASSFAIFADQESSWGIWPKETDSDPPLFWLMPSGINDVHSALIDWLGIRDELMENVMNSK